MTGQRPTTAEVAAGYTALWLAGDHRAAGQRTPHSQIIVFALRDGKIIQERHFTE